MSSGRKCRGPQNQIPPREYGDIRDLCKFHGFLKMVFTAPDTTVHVFFYKYSIRVVDSENIRSICNVQMGAATNPTSIVPVY